MKFSSSSLVLLPVCVTIMYNRSVQPSALYQTHSLWAPIFLSGTLLVKNGHVKYFLRSSCPAICLEGATWKGILELVCLLHELPFLYCHGAGVGRKAVVCSWEELRRRTDS